MDDLGMDDLGRDLITGGLIDDLKEPPIRPPELLAKAGLKEEKFNTKKRTAAKNVLRAQRRIRLATAVLMLLCLPSFDCTLFESWLIKGIRKASRAVVDGGKTMVGLVMPFFNIGAAIVGLNLLVAT
jgi:hypothetical protein